MQQMIAAMDAAGIGKSALVQASTCHGHDNSYVADAVAAHPERFTGVFSDSLAPDAPERMRYWYSRGLTGMRLLMFGSTVSQQAPWLDDPKTYPAWECAADLGLSICLQMAPEAIPQAISMAKRFPSLRIIIDHCARPKLEDGPPYKAAFDLLSLSGYANVYLKLTPRVFEEASSGKATPETFFPVAGVRVRRRPACLGFELSGLARPTRGSAGGRTTFACLLAAGGPGLDIREDGADALSCAGRLRRRP